LSCTRFKPLLPDIDLPLQLVIDVPIRPSEIAVKVLDGIRWFPHFANLPSIEAKLTSDFRNLKLSYITKWAEVLTLNDGPSSRASNLVNDIKYECSIPQQELDTELCAFFCQFFHLERLRPR